MVQGLTDRLNHAASPANASFAVSETIYFAFRCLLPVCREEIQEDADALSRSKCLQWGPDVLPFRGAY